MKPEYIWIDEAEEIKQEDWEKIRPAMKKILIITPFYPPNIGGAETFVKGLVDEAKEWFDVTVLTFQPFGKRVSDFSKFYTARGSITIRRIDWGITHAQAWQGTSFRNFMSAFPRMFFKARKLHRRERFDVIHAQGLISGLVGALIKGKSRLMITLLALYKFHRKPHWFCWISRWVFMKCDCVFVEGQKGQWDMWEAFTKFFKHMGDVKDYESKVTVKQFRHWCDHDKFRPNENRIIDKTRILFIGRPLPEKGMDIVKMAEAQIKDQNVEFEYVTNAEFEDLPKIYQRADILCVPSQYDEGHSRVVIEGASSGLAVITSNRGSLPEQVKDFGYVSSTEKFARNLRYVIENVKPYKKVALNYARLNFTKTNALVFLDEYRK